MILIWNLANPPDSNPTQFQGMPYPEDCGSPSARWCTSWHLHSYQTVGFSASEIDKCEGHSNNISLVWKCMKSWTVDSK